LDQIKDFVFDIIASNSGRLIGAWVLLEQKLNRSILFFACRHHIFEIILKAVIFISKLSVMSEPDNPLFKWLKSN
jgi:hypothetical protein